MRLLQARQVFSAVAVSAAVAVGRSAVRNTVVAPQKKALL